MDRVAVLDRTNFYAPGEIGKTRRLTPEGFMVCEGVAIARTGEQRYHKTELPLDPDGAGEITVTRTPEEVFRADTIASFEGKSVTLEHPNDFLTPDSWKDHEVGTAHNVRRGTGIEDDLLLADLLIKDGEAIAFINKKRPEVSSGYDAEYEQTGPGRATQHNILANHIALLVGRGRAGSRCAVRDSEWEAAVRDAFDPKEPRDESGKWTALAKTAERHAHAAGGDKFVIERSANARHATEEAMASGEPRLHDKAAFSHNVAISFHEEQAKKKSTTPAARASHQQAISAHTSVMQMHRKQSGETYAAPPLPLGKSPRVKKHSYYKAAKDSRSTHGDKSMKSRFADKFIRVMQAFSAKDAVALDRELATEDHSTEDSDTATDARINDALHWIDAQRAAARDAEEAAAKKEEDCDMEEKKKAKDAQAAKDSAAALEAARAARDVGVLNTTDASQVFKHVMARAEILFPGIQVPTGDSATAKDAIPQLMLRTVKAAYATDTGKAVIDPFLLGEAIEAVTVDNVSGVFTGAAELMRQRNNQAGSNTKLSVKDFGSKTITPKTLEQMNRDFWDKRTSA
jgi:hypothetical protein